MATPSDLKAALGLLSEEDAALTEQMAGKTLLRSKGYFVMDDADIPATLSLSSYLVSPVAVVSLKNLPSVVRGLRSQGLAEGLMPSSVEVIDHLESAGVAAKTKVPKDAVRWAVVTTFMVKDRRSPFHSRELFFVGAAVKPPAPDLKKAATESAHETERAEKRPREE